jgi:hypothetical protein
MPAVRPSRWPPRPTRAAPSSIPVADRWSTSLTGAARSIRAHSLTRMAWPTWSGRPIRTPSTSRRASGSNRSARTAPPWPGPPPSCSATAPVGEPAHRGALHRRGRKHLFPVLFGELVEHRPLLDRLRHRHGRGRPLHQNQHFEGLDRLRRGCGRPRRTGMVHRHNRATTDGLPRVDAGTRRLSRWSPQPAPCHRRPYRTGTGDLLKQPVHARPITTRLCASAAPTAGGVFAPRWPGPACLEAPGPATFPEGRPEVAWVQTSE